MIFFILDASNNIGRAVELLGIVRTERRPFVARCNVVSGFFMEVELEKLNHAMDHAMNSQIAS